MRVVCLDGKFGYTSEQINSGLVILCHFESMDDQVVLLQALNAISKFKQSSIILVPFVHLYEKVAPKPLAEELFMKLEKMLMGQGKMVIKVPFGIEKEFHLFAQEKNEAIKFMKFSHNKNEIKWLYDNCSKDYNQHMVDTGHYKAQEAILTQVSSFIKYPLLDLACGPGFLLSKLAKDNQILFGNDFSKSMLDLAMKQLQGCNVTFSNDDATMLGSYKSKSISTIVCCNLFFYLQKQDEALQRWKRLIKNDGHIIFIEEYPFIRPASDEMDEHTEKLMDVIDPISPDEICQIAENNGLKLELKINVPIDDKHDLYGMVFSKSTFA